MNYILTATLNGRLAWTGLLFDNHAMVERLNIDATLRFIQQQGGTSGRFRWGYYLVDWRQTNGN